MQKALVSIMLIRVKVLPNSRRNTVTKTGESSYEARLNAAPEKGKANAKLVELLAKHFGVPKSAIRIIKGNKSRNKSVEVNI